MNFTNTLINHLSEKNLLNHEFYQAWNCGSVPMETLQLYARQYYHHVKAFPRYISATHSNCESLQARQFLLENLNDEEQGPENHPELWLRFAEGLGASRESVETSEPLPEIQNLVGTFLKSARSSYAEGLGALFAYEHQIPEIATFKIEALKKHYDVQEQSTLSFFEVHRKADVYHTETLKQLMDDLSLEEQELAKKSATVTADHLWKFLDAIHRTMSV
jgi:pyrroloquinoline-quinone synthase